MILKYILKFLCLFGITFSLLIITANAEELKEKENLSDKGEEAEDESGGN